jgi:hypothetical protein
MLIGIFRVGLRIVAGISLTSLKKIMKLGFFNRVRWAMEFQVRGLKIYHVEIALALMRFNSFLYERFYDKLKINYKLIPNNCLKTYSSNFCPLLILI